MMHGLGVDSGTPGQPEAGGFPNIKRIDTENYSCYHILAAIDTAP